jgi:bifunctional ADP-heptose synthase (sugar kinase/adenylyltransferase)
MYSLFDFNYLKMDSLKDTREERIKRLLGPQEKKQYSPKELGVFDCVEAVEAYVALVLSDYRRGDLTENQEVALERLGNMTSMTVAVDVVDKYL